MKNQGIKYFVGKNSSNHAIVGNGEVAMSLQQFMDSSILTAGHDGGVQS